MIVAVPGFAAATVAALLVGFGTGPVLRRLPEPQLEEGEVKVHYADLSTSAFVGCCTTLAALAVLVPAAVLPLRVLPVWWVLAVPVLLLVAVDARTTWIPRRLSRVSGQTMIGAAGVMTVLAGDPALLGRTVLGATASFGLFWAVWRLSRGGLAFGDVLLAPLTGAASAAAGWPMWVSATVLGGVAGAVYGFVLLVARRGRAFAYTPAMLVGPYLACLTRLWV